MYLLGVEMKFYSWNNSWPVYFTRKLEIDTSYAALLTAFYFLKIFHMPAASVGKKGRFSNLPIQEPSFLF